MAVSNITETTSFASSNELDTWLSRHYASKSELWIKVYKKGSGIASVSWDDIVIECLCWGWIDGIKKSLDDDAYLQRITPRKPKSIWSKRNTEHVKRLITEGRMQEPGLVHVRAAKADGRWQSAYRAGDVTVPDDFLQVLESVPSAKAFYARLPKSSRAIIAHGLNSAKKAETRQRRFEKFMDAMLNEEKI